jgi:hypothetical protein
MAQFTTDLGHISGQNNVVADRNLIRVPVHFRYYLTSLLPLSPTIACNTVHQPDAIVLYTSEARGWGCLPQPSTRRGKPRDLPNLCDGGTILGN